tara:strand:+ start:712 stop:1179 length:468 start_codon:yes stop_codon:yes gene_type:complete
MKKVFINFFIFLLIFNTSLAEDRDFRPVAKTKDALYLLDYLSIKQGEGDEIKYIKLVSYKTSKITSDGKKYKSVQIYMKGKCKKKMNLPYIMQFYDAQMNDGNVMKGNIVRTSKFVGDWEVSKTGTTYEIVLRKACKNYEDFKLAHEMLKKLKKK